MNAPAPDTHRATQAWLSALPPAYAGGESDAVRHAIFLQRCFDGREMRWSDALVVRTRRHIGGCLVATEMALGLELRASYPEFPLPSDPVCWARVQQDPSLLSPSLLAHMRDRAAIGLMGRDLALGDTAHNDADRESELFPPSARELLDAVSLGQAGWNDIGPDASPMRVDLPAEMLPELVWTVGALLADTVIDADQSTTVRCVEIDHACSAILARYDEQPMPFAQAALFAHQMHGLGIDEAYLLYLSRSRAVLALLAIAADRLGVELPCLVRHVVEASEQALFTLCRAADFPREVAVRLVLGRRSVARGADDSVLVHYADGYDGMTLAEAQRDMAMLGLSPYLRSQLSRVRSLKAYHGL